MSKTIAILRTGGAGDVILSTVAINVIRDVLPGCRILWFGREPLNSLVRDVYTGVEVYELRQGNSYSENLSLIKRAADKVDAVIDLQRSARTMVLGRMAAAHFGCAYTTWNKYSMARGWLVLQAHMRGRGSGSPMMGRPLTNRYEAMAQCTLRALAKLNIDTQGNAAFRPGFGSIGTKREEGAIAICLGAKFEMKSLPVPVVARIIRRLLQDGRVSKIYFLGDADQRENAEMLIKDIPGSIALTNLCGATTLTQAARVLGACSLAVANDSGLAHLAEAAGTPVLMFFGPTHEHFGYRPYLDGSRTLSVDIGCRPCNKSGDTRCRYGDHACATLITDEMIQKQLTATRYA